MKQRTHFVVRHDGAIRGVTTNLAKARSMLCPFAQIVTVPGVFISRSGKILDGNAWSLAKRLARETAVKMELIDAAEKLCKHVIEGSRSDQDRSLDQIESAICDAHCDHAECDRIEHDDRIVGLSYPTI